LRIGTTARRCAVARLFIAASGITLAAFLFNPSSLSALNFDDPVESEKLADALLATMTDEEALSQTLMFGWVGADPSPLILEWVQKRRLGGVKIFGWNTEDTQRLAKAVGLLQKAALGSKLGIPLLVATDQEGGWIRHVKGMTSETPGNMAIGASGYPRDSYLSGFYIGREIAALGINMNFAPTVDLYTNKNSYLIGPRAFSDDPVQTATLGAAFAQGLASAGVIATAKHFPGHGDTALDSHGVLPEIDVSLDQLWDRELIPYRLLAKEGIPAIMSGHLAFPRTSARSAPASLSSYFLTDLLRGKMGYTGLIITDDLLMSGASNYAGDLAHTARRALEAGNDIIMFSKTPSLDDRLWEYLTESCRNDAKFRSRVRDAARRVLILKLDHLRGKNAPERIPSPSEVVKRVPDREGQAFFLDLAVRSITIVKGGNIEKGKTKPLIPLSPKDAGRVLLAGQFEDFFSSGQAAYPDSKIFRFSYSNGDKSLSEDRAELLRLARNMDTVILCVANNASLELMQALRTLDLTTIAFSVLTPVYLDKAAWVDGALASYSYAKESFIAGFSVLSGRTASQGSVPFPLRAGRAP